MPVTCFSSSEDKKIAYAQIRNQFTALQDLIHVCNRRHNDLNITARLPDNVLSEIFLWNRSFQPSGNDKPSWFRVAFVCTEWRRVAIDCATLWTRFSHEKHVEWLTQVIIPRSKNALLSVNMTLEPDPSKDKQWEGARSLLREHSRRIREIGLNFLARSGWQPAEVADLLSHLTNPLPSLEILRVSITTGDAAKKTTICIPSNVPGEVHAPNLKSLTLMGEVKLAPAASPRVPLLITTLTLEYRGTSSVLEIISLLESSKKLQNLTLKLTARSEDADSSSSFDNLKHYSRFPVVLRELKRFTLVDTCKRCLSILSSISCPAAINIKVEVLHFHVPYEFEELVQKFATLIHPVKSLTIKVWPLCSDFDKTILLSVRGPLRLGNIENQSSWESPPSDFSSSSSESPIQTDLVELSIQISVSRSDKTAFSTLLNPFDFQDLEILEMSPGVSANTLKAKFGSLSLLHTISIMGDIYSHATRGVAEALVGDEVSPDSRQSRSWYLGVRNSRLNPRIVDVDAENEVLAIAQNNFLARIKSPLPFPALKCLKNVSTDSNDLKVQLGFACLLRQTLGIPLGELSLRCVEYMKTTSKSSDDLDRAMIRQSVGVLSCT